MSWSTRVSGLKWVLIYTVVSQILVHFHSRMSRAADAAYPSAEFWLYAALYYLLDLSLALTFVFLLLHHNRAKQEPTYRVIDIAPDVTVFLTLIHFTRLLLSAPINARLWKAGLSRIYLIPYGLAFLAGCWLAAHAFLLRRQSRSRLVQA